VKKETREDMTSPKTKDKGVYCYACKLECHDFEVRTIPGSRVSIENTSKVNKMNLQSLE
jgi:hypothetical protein